MNASTGTSEDGATDAGRRLGEEFRLLLDALAERAEPWLNQLATPRPDAAGQRPGTCEWCPVCAAIALVRGEHSELAGRAAEHLLGLLVLVRAGLAAPTHHAGHHHAGYHAASTAGRDTDASQPGDDAAPADATGPAGGTGPEAGPSAPRPGPTGPDAVPTEPPGAAAPAPAGQSVPGGGFAPSEADGERVTRVQRITVRRRTGAGATNGTAASEAEC
ncbi:hypothetical protein [Gandjariella thermophila]|uniref:Uncharacterized protein n=1 Tax=Gandjariella thermophila TaxID=1931992 RepID=A0A4D4J931_9PSEU|nr:hypothetical protein [Gandjariella thermophila]GDY30373.1 hypothetical protein GTS_20060 [Gandjariella thermophila]